MRLKKRRLFAFFVIAFACIWTHPAAADQIITKSGHVYKGKLQKIANKTYYFKTDDGETAEIPVESVYMGDFEPTKDSAFKNYLIVHSNSKDEEKQTDAAPEAKSEDGPTSPDARGIVVLKPHSDILKHAQDTVALSNQRTAQMEQQIKELKDIADNANK